MGRGNQTNLRYPQQAQISLIYKHKRARYPLQMMQLKKQVKKEKEKKSEPVKHTLFIKIYINQSDCSARPTH